MERHLADYPGTVIAVTHDRYFLDNVAGWILELDRGRGIPFEGNYSSWLEQKQAKLLAQEKADQKRIKTLERELEWVRNNKPVYSSFVFKIKRLEIFDKKTAVIAGTGIVKGAPGPDGPMDFTYESSNVLIKRDGRWQAILSHVSGIVEEK